MSTRRKPSSGKPVRNIPVLDAAEQISVDPETVRRYVREGCPHDRKGTKILLNVPELSAWMKANGRTGKQGVSPGDEESPDLEAVRIRKETALAIRYERDNRKAEGELIELTQIEQWIAEVFGTAKHKLIAMASALAPRLEGMDAGERQTEITKYVEQVIGEVQSACERMEVGVEAT